MSSTLTISLSAVTVALIMTAAIGALLGTFRRGVIRELREALQTAELEISVNRGIVSRLENHVAKLDARCDILERENQSLREILSSGSHLAPVIGAELHKHYVAMKKFHIALARHLGADEGLAGAILLAEEES